MSIESEDGFDMIMIGIKVWSYECRDSRYIESNLGAIKSGNA